ncbi:hypothetical protein AOQ84DRAFT_222362, partial [Glonium stellatum]
SGPGLGVELEVDGEGGAQGRGGGEARGAAQGGGGAQGQGQGRRRRRKKWAASGTEASAPPVLVFEHKNSTGAALGFDVHTETGLVAAGDEDGAVLVYSLLTGEKLREFRPEVEGSGHGWRSRCVRFVEDEGGRLSVLAALGREVVEFAW